MCSVRQNNAIDGTWQLMLAVALRQAAQPNTHVLDNTILCLWCNTEERLACSSIVVYGEVKYLREDCVSSCKF